MIRINETYIVDKTPTKFIYKPFETTKNNKKMTAVEQ